MSRGAQHFGQRAPINVSTATIEHHHRMLQRRNVAVTMYLCEGDRGMAIHREPQRHTPFVEIGIFSKSIPLDEFTAAVHAAADEYTETYGRAWRAVA